MSDTKGTVRRLICAVCFILVPGHAAAQHACANIVDAQQRLACYDTAFPPVSGARTDPADLALQREAALRDFGLNKAQLREAEPELMQVLAPDRIQAKVVHVRENGDGRRTVTLDNHQMWLLTEATSKGWLDSGDTVTVKEAAFGSYMLLTPSGIGLRARRVR